MPALSWTECHSPDLEREYLVMASYLPLKKFIATPRFLRYVVQVRRQLAAADGLVGYALDAHPLDREYWTLSAWDNAEALRDFVVDQPHSDAMESLADDMRPTRFVQWKAKGIDLPPTWEQGRARLSTESALN